MKYDFFDKDFCAIITIPENTCHKAGWERGIAMKLFHTALVLGKGGFGTQLGEMLAEAGGYSRILYLDDQAPDAAGKLADYLDPTIRERCTAAFVGLGNNELRLQWLQKLVAAGYQTRCLNTGGRSMQQRSPGGRDRGAAICLCGLQEPKWGQGASSMPVPLWTITPCWKTVCMPPPRATIKAGATVERCMKVDSGEIIRSPWEK